RRVALARARAPRAAGVGEQDAEVLQRRLEAVANRPPGAHVLRLLLGPDDLTEVRVSGDELGIGLDRKRIELLEPGDGDVSCPGAFFVSGNVVIDLSRAHDEARYAFALRARIVDHGLEGAFGEIGEGRRGLLQ